MTQASTIRVLLVEDSRSQRELLAGIISAAAGFVLVGTASTGREAVSETQRLRPDVVAMDIHLPGMNGFEATQQIMHICPTPVVMISGASRDDARHSMDAIAAGALAVVRKPFGIGGSDHQSFLKTLRLMAGVKVVTRFARRPTPAATAPAQPLQGVPQIIAIAASTGGPAAIQRLLTDLGGDQQLPIVIVQHITAGFTTALADWLGSTVPQSVLLAQPDQPLLPGSVTLAPDSAHLILTARGRVSIAPQQPGDRFCPSADRLFQSVAQVYGRHSLALMLTGMGDDGVRGLASLRSAGGYVIAQDQSSSVVFGMPGAAVAAGVVHQVLPLDRIAEAVRRIAGASQ